MEINKDTIYSLKMNSGEEVIAKVTSVSDTTITVASPCSIGPGPNGGLGLVPTMFTYNPESEVKLNTNSIAMIADTDESIKSKYIQATTGIKLPDKKIILG